MRNLICRKKARFSQYLKNKSLDKNILKDAARLAAAGEYQRALDKIGNVFWIYSSPTEALRLKGNILELQYFSDNSYIRNLFNARKIYNRALALDPDDQETIADLRENAQEFYEAGLNDQA